jgi:thiamine biosynthesis protein ThiI
MIDAIIIHTDEIALKGGNRPFFERALLKNIRARLENFGDFSFSNRKGTILVRCGEAVSDEKAAELTASLRTVFGIACFKLAEECATDLQAIKDVAVRLTAGLSGTFRVTAKRANKRFAHDSIEVSRQVGGAVLAHNDQLKVDLHQPDHTVFVEVNEDGSFVSLDKIPGVGGLPTGTTGRVAVMLSGGIDSPVAAHKVMSRGCRAVFVHFHSYPHVGRESIEKVKRLAEALNRYQLRSKLYLVPFADIQREITAKTDGKLRVVLYRRAMLRICEQIAEREHALGLVTGDAIGQVASQTLENLATVGAAVRLPVHRPLVGDGKLSIVKHAKSIGTYDISIEPHDDCCTLFVPDHPELRSTPVQAEAEEAKLDVAEMITAAIAQAEIETL